ncbi:MAG: 16S rRNA (guanine(527)-N(7))-methyltransferase RsmG [Rhodobacteraceae bacterium]|nr:16S rRNA (guanine(527)-N(7))-methyltransferase RsmG [Paracoccaceae bacterium]
MNEFDLKSFDVSRETIERLENFSSLVHKWNPHINLVSKKSLSELWQRHIVDSIQVFRAVKPKGHWVDIGSGGGFPGVVVALLAADEVPELKVTLIESDQRKCAFLRTALRECGASGTVLSKRIEEAPPQGADILSARALADLDVLLSFANRHLSPTGIALFPKGITWRKELEAARHSWCFNVEDITSITEPEAAILKIRGVSGG